MIRWQVNINDVVNLLNDALKVDPQAVTALINTRVQCNNELADHPTIQVGLFDGEYRVGLLGILNGIFGIADDGWGPIAVIIGADGIVTGFQQCRSAEVEPSD